MAASFPISDIQALIADAENIYASSLDALQHAKNVWDWLTGQIPVVFGGKVKMTAGSPTLCPCPPDPLAVSKQFVADQQAPGVKATALDPSVIAALFQLIAMLLDRFFPRPTPTPP